MDHAHTRKRISKGTRVAVFPRSAPSSERLGEVDSQHRIGQLELEVTRLKEQLALLQDKLRDIPRTSAVAVSVPEAGVKPYTNQYKRWVQEHMDELERYPNCFIAIDPSLGKKGLVICSQDEQDFSRQVRKIYEEDPDSRHRLLLTHTSAYL